MPGTRQTRQSLRQTVVEGIKGYILDNRLRPGDPLPTEPELCQALGASRSSVREAVKVLNALDIVEVRHGHGTFVGRLSLSALVESLTFRGLLSVEDDVQVLSDLIDVRELFEHGMADRIVAALDERQLDALDAVVSDMKAQADSDSVSTALVGADRDFHALLVAPLHNDLIAQLSLAFWDVYAVVAPHLHGFGPEEAAEAAAAHKEIVEAARAGDLDRFRAAVTAHYAPVRSRLAAAG
ncbi:FadR/GntR family transcriptional regulator [Streptomyces tsukubensis]|uniref:GntR family transcriptional regulator n=1 Tax=Streptomyces tsukubensis TaxID=83656 RepID=A0A1V4AHA4_9ACTN|nr:FCD domain-containing protein [Streptomyces tsukubensis]OON82823.1 GntR family transcriptional regulator [Streptomyces tsukubensis]QFR92002.1 FCD domain-containing protein [Streptomyces tsukubensis]